MPEILQVSSAREVLALIPYQVGFTPTDSLVVISLRGPRQQVGLIARVDLDEVPEAAFAIAEHIKADSARSSIVVAYTTDLDLAHDGAVFAVDALVGAGAPPVSVLWVTPHDFRAINPERPQDCPATGEPLDLDTTVVAATHVAHGRQQVPTRDDLRIVPASEEARTAAREAYELKVSEMKVCFSRPAALGFWRDALHERFPTPEVLGRLAAVLNDMLVRDAVLASLVDENGAQDVLVNSDNSGEVFETIFAPASPPPEREAIDPTRNLLIRMAAHVNSPPALTLLAFLSWWEGDGAKANVYLEAVTTPYPFADLIRQALLMGMGPGWTR